MNKESLDINYIKNIFSGLIKHLTSINSNASSFKTDKIKQIKEDYIEERIDDCLYSVVAKKNVKKESNDYIENSETNNNKNYMNYMVIDCVSSNNALVDDQECKYVSHNTDSCLDSNSSPEKNTNEEDNIRQYKPYSIFSINNTCKSPSNKRLKRRVFEFPTLIKKSNSSGALLSINKSDNPFSTSNLFNKNHTINNFSNSKNNIQRINNINNNSNKLASNSIFAATILKHPSKNITNNLIYNKSQDDIYNKINKSKDNQEQENKNNYFMDEEQDKTNLNKYNISENKIINISNVNHYINNSSNIKSNMYNNKDINKDINDNIYTSKLSSNSGIEYRKHLTKSASNTSIIDHTNAFNNTRYKNKLFRIYNSLLKEDYDTRNTCYNINNNNDYVEVIHWEHSPSVINQPFDLFLESIIHSLDLNASELIKSIILFNKISFNDDLLITSEVVNKLLGISVYLVIKYVEEKIDSNNSDNIISLNSICNYLGLSITEIKELECYCLKALNLTFKHTNNYIKNLLITDEEYWSYISLISQ